MAGPSNTGPVGGPIPQIQPTRWGRNESGNYEVWIYEGTPKAITALATQFSNTPGLMYEVQNGFGKSRLEVNFPWNQDGFVNPVTDVIERWELFANHAEKDLLSAQDQAGLVATLSQQQKEVIRQKLLTPPLGTTTIADFQGMGGNAANALTIYTLMQAGMRSYLMEAPVMRRTITTSLQYAIAYSMLNIKRLLSTATLIINENVPNSLLFNLNTLTGGDVSTDPNLVYGWYKSFPNVQQIALMKWQITMEWQYGWWPIVYGTVL